MKKGLFAALILSVSLSLLAYAGDGRIINADISDVAGIVYSKLNLSNSIVAGDITSGAITNAKQANMADQTVKGNVSGVAAAPSDLSKTQLTTLINPFTSLLSGAAPASGGGTSNFLRADGSWAAPTGTPSPLTTKGDLYTYDTGNARLPVGTNGYVLTADSTQATGIKWAAPTSGAPTTSAISALDVDWATLLNTGGVYTKTLGANSTFTFSNQLAGQAIIVRITNPSTYTVTWPTVIWPGGIPPTQSTGNKSDVYTFIYDGVATYGSYVQESMGFTGTVESVALSLPSIFSVSGSPVTTSGTLSATLASQTQNTFFAAPDGSSGAPSFRAIVAADVPTLNQNTTGNANTATALAANPSDCAADTYATTIAANGNLTCSTVSDAGLAVSYLKADGTRALTGNWNAGAFNITANTFIGALTGNASTATALAANGTNCSSGQFGKGVDASGNSESCAALVGTDLPAPTTSTISASAIDWATLKNVDGLYTKTLSANTTFTFSNVTAGQTIVIAITNTASNYTVTWPAAAKWSGGTAPTQTIGAKTDVYTCKAYDSTNAYCTYVQNY